MYFILAKIHPFLKELREKIGDPNLFRNIEKVINSSKFGRERLQFTIKRVETCAKNAKQAAKAPVAARSSLLEAPRFCYPNRLCG